MLPRPLPAPFDSDEHLFEPWWGGERALVLIGPADIAGHGRGPGRRRRRARPDRRPARAGRARRPGRGALGDPRRRAGRRRRLRAGRRRRSWRAGSRATPGAPSRSCAFDLLHLDGRSLLSQPLVRRREALRRVLRPGDEVVAVPAIATEGVALYEAVVAQGLAGMHGPPADEPVPARRPQPAVAVRRGRAGSAAGERAGGRRRRNRRAERRRPRPRPVLALISRLPLDDLDGLTRRAVAQARPALPGPARRRDERPERPAAARTAGRPPRTSGRPRRRRPRWPPRAAPIDSASSHGCTAATMTRASITNGLNGGTNDATRIQVAAAAARARRSPAGSRPSRRRLSGSDSVCRSSGRLTNEPIAA